MLFIIGGLQKTTLLDYPNKVAAIVFTQGCNFRCGYCHNPELLQYKKNTTVSIESFFEFLNKRKGKLDGIVITGGEPTVQIGLYDFIEKVKSMGFSVKLDTNGTNPKILKKLIKNQLIDYIAMDIKAPLEKYSEITKTNINPEEISESINIIINSKVDYEFRTTVIKSQLTYSDFEKIGKLIKGAKKYYLQKFIPSKILDNTFNNAKTYTDEEFQQIINNLKNYIEYVCVR